MQLRTELETLLCKFCYACAFPRQTLKRSKSFEPPWSANAAVGFCVLHLCGLQASVAALEAKLGDVYVNDAFGTAHRARILDLL